LSAIPQELRDDVVRRLENAVADRDRHLLQAQHDAGVLRRELGELEGNMERQREALHEIQKELAQLGQSLARERREAHERLERLRARSEEQYRRLEAALQEAERRHRQEWEALQARIEELAHTREQRERQTRDAGLQALVRAQEALQGLDRGQLEAMDLLGNLAGAEARIAAARAVAASPEAPAAEVLSAGRGAEEAVLLVAALSERRRAMVAGLSRELAAEADWLDALLGGAAMLDLPDQSDSMGRLLVLETRRMRSLIEIHVRAAAAALVRWNGHAARAARIEGIRDLLGAEILRARKAMGGAVEHEESRYVLKHIWDDLVLRFGAIPDRGSGTEGAWSIPEDRKSSYLYFLASGHGELIIEVPWSGAIVVRHEGREMQRHALFQEPDDDARRIGELAGHWQGLAARLANPNWDPDLP
jgi:hypothetical protein